VYKYWKVGEWLKPTDCKSVLFEYGGSNPSLSTKIKNYKKGVKTFYIYII
jgi:hypothetical protein